MFSSRRALFREILLVFGWLAVALLLLTLLTYSPSDPAWSVASGEDAAGGEIQNRFGAAGAHIADILLSALGYSSYLLCLAACVALHSALRPARGAAAERLGGWWCALGLLLLMLSSAALENIRFAEYANERWGAPTFSGNRSKRSPAGCALSPSVTRPKAASRNGTTTF